jgi:hypothetical protein
VHHRWFGAHRATYFSRQSIQMFSCPPPVGSHHHELAPASVPRVPDIPWDGKSSRPGAVLRYCFAFATHSSMWRTRDVKAKHAPNSCPSRMTWHGMACGWHVGPVTKPPGKCTFCPLATLATQLKSPGLVLQCKPPQNGQPILLTPVGVIWWRRLVVSYLA